MMMMMMIIIIISGRLDAGGQTAWDLYSAALSAMQFLGLVALPQAGLALSSEPLVCNLAHEKIAS